MNTTEILNTVSQYKNRSELRNKNYSLYQLIRKSKEPLIIETFNNLLGRDTKNKYSMKTTKEILVELKKYSNRTELSKKKKGLFKFVKESTDPEIQEAYDALLKRKNYTLSEQEIKEVIKEKTLTELLKERGRGFVEFVARKGFYHLIKKNSTENKVDSVDIQNEKIIEELYFTRNTPIYLLKKEINTKEYKKLSAVYEHHQTINRKLHIKQWKINRVNAFLKKNKISNIILEEESPILKLNQIYKDHEQIRKDLFTELIEIKLFVSQNDLVWRLKAIHNLKNLEIALNFYFLEIEYYALHAFCEHLKLVKDPFRIRNLFKNYENLDNFKANHPREYRFAKYSGLLMELIKENNPTLEDKKEQIINKYREKIKDYSTVGAFRKENPGLYTAIRRYGVFDQFQNEFKLRAVY